MIQPSLHCKTIFLGKWVNMLHLGRSTLVFTARTIPFPASMPQYVIQSQSTLSRLPLIQSQWWHCSMVLPSTCQFLVLHEKIQQNISSLK